MVANVLGPVLVKHNNDIPFMVGSFTVALMLSHQLQLYFSLLRMSLSSLSKHCVKIVIKITCRHSDQLIVYQNK